MNEQRSIPKPTRLRPILAYNQAKDRYSIFSPLAWKHLCAISEGTERVQRIPKQGYVEVKHPEDVAQRVPPEAIKLTAEQEREEFLSGVPDEEIVYSDEDANEQVTKKRGRPKKTDLG